MEQETFETSKMQGYNFEKTFKTEKIILSLLGFFPFKDPGRFSWRIMRRVSVFTLLVIFFCHMVSQAFYVDFNGLIEPSMIWVPEFGLLCKILVFIYHGDGVEMIEEELKQPTYSKLDKQYSRELEYENKFTMKFTIIYRFVTVSFTCYLLLVTPFIGNKGERNLPLEAHMPCDLEDNVCYFGFLTFQFIAGYISAQTNVVMDCLFCKLLTASCCLFTILHNNLSNIDYGDEEIAERELRDSVMLHQKLLRYTKLVDTVFNKVVFFQCFTSMFAICITLFQMLQVDMISLNFIATFNFFMVMLIEIGIFCWYGNNLMTKSEHVRTACYMSNWYTGSIKLRKTLFILMERTKRPLLMVAGNIFTLSLQTFTSILKSSYSLLRLLSELYD